jgi:hypothetical protein
MMVRTVNQGRKSGRAKTVFAPLSPEDVSLVVKGQTQSSKVDPDLLEGQEKDEINPFLSKLLDTVETEELEESEESKEASSDSESDTDSDEEEDDAENGEEEEDTPISKEKEADEADAHQSEKTTTVEDTMEEDEDEDNEAADTESAHKSEKTTEEEDVVQKTTNQPRHRWKRMWWTLLQLKVQIHPKNQRKLQVQRHPKNQKNKRPSHLLAPENIICTTNQWMIKSMVYVNLPMWPRHLKEKTDAA